MRQQRLHERQANLVGGARWWAIGVEMRGASGIRGGLVVLGGIETV